MKRIELISSLILFCVSLIHGQTQFPNLVPMDESMQKLMEFYNTDSIYVVTPNGYQIKDEDQAAIEKFAFWKESLKYNYISDLQVNKLSSEAHCLFFGPIKDFQTDVLNETPFTFWNDGFSYQGRRFIKPEDSFYYMNNSATRVFSCFNSEINATTFLDFLAGGVFQLYIFNGKSISIAGFDKLDGSVPSVNDYDALRAGYFCKKVTSQFFDLHFACNSEQYDSESLSKELDQFVVEFCNHIEVDTTRIPRVTTYVYSNREDLQTFIAAPSQQTVYGKSLGKINHIMHFDMGIFKHEAGHSIIGNKVGKNTSPFFDEGFRQYTDYLFSQSAYDNDLIKYKEGGADQLTPELVLAKDYRFFNSMDNYCLSGVFVKFIIDRIGLADFKVAYKNNAIEEALHGKGLTVNGLINELRILNGFKPLE